MAATQQTASRAFGTAGTTAQPESVWGLRKSRPALVVALCVTLLGAFAYGIFTAIDGGSTGNDAEAFIHRAEQNAAHLNAMAEAFGSGALTSSPATDARALEAYGERWAALGDSLAPNAGRCGPRCIWRALDGTRRASRAAIVEPGGN